MPEKTKGRIKNKADSSFFTGQPKVFGPMGLNQLEKNACSWAEHANRLIPKME